MSASVTPFDPGAALARIKPTAAGWTIDTRGPHGARHYDFTQPGETAEFAIVLRDEGKWPLRFSPGADVVRAIVDGLTDGDAP